VSRLLLLAATSALLGAVASGCGGSKTPAVASVGKPAASGASASTPSGGAEPAPDAGTNPNGGPAAVFDACLRTHGVPNMPGPSPVKSATIVGVDPNSPLFQTAERECAKLVPKDAPPALVPQRVGPLLAFAKCMRSHGIVSFPDPNSEGHFEPGSMGGVDPESSLFQTALEHCRSLTDGEPIAGFRG